MHLFEKTNLKKFTTFALIFITALMALSVSASRAGADDEGSSEQMLISEAPFANNLGSYTPVDSVNPDATVVTVGFYGVNAYEIETSSNTFQFKGYMWLRWTGEADPVSTLEFANSVEEWGLMVTNLTEKPVLLASGENLQAMRIQGRFFQPFQLENYPLDSQQLNIYIEDSVNDANTIVYQADSVASGFDETFKVPGWNLESLSTKQLVHNYNSNFGDNTLEPAGYSALQFSFNIERVQNLFWWKLLLPLILVLITNWLALLLSPKFAEIRTAMPATALLTTVFLQQSSLDAIPQVSSLVLMDFIYVLAYSMIVITFGQIVWDNHHIKDENPKKIARVQKFDRISIGVQVVFFAIGLALLVSTAL